MSRSLQMQGFPASRRKSHIRRLVTGLAFASPWLIGFVIFTAGPIAASGYYSLTRFNLFQPPEFVGLENYVKLLNDPNFRQSAFNTVYLTAVGLPISIVLALLCALVLNFDLKGQAIYRAILYLPSIVPVVVAAYVWRWMLTGPWGLVNYILSLFHISFPAWLGDPVWTKPAAILVSLWTIGGMSIIYLAALKNVPRDLYQAAEVDGAGPWRRFWDITIPSISPVTLFLLIVGVIAWLQIFTQPYLLVQGGTSYNAASGGPGNSLLTYTMYLFENAFVFLKMGTASAMAWLLFIVTMAVTAVILLTSRNWVHYGE